MSSFPICQAHAQHLRPPRTEYELTFVYWTKSTETTCVQATHRVHIALGAHALPFHSTFPQSHHPIINHHSSTLSHQECSSNTTRHTGNSESPAGTLFCLPAPQGCRLTHIRFLVTQTLLLLTGLIGVPHAPVVWVCSFGFRYVHLDACLKTQSHHAHVGHQERRP